VAVVNVQRFVLAADGAPPVLLAQHRVPFEYADAVEVAQRPVLPGMLVAEPVLERTPGLITVHDLARPGLGEVVRAVPPAIRAGDAAREAAGVAGGTRPT